MYAQILVRVWPKYMLNNVIYPGQVEWRRLRHEQIGQRRSLLFYAEEGKPTRDVRNFFAGGGAARPRTSPAGYVTRSAKLWPGGDAYQDKCFSSMDIHNAILHIKT